jgi:hypothetical protein
MSPRRPLLANADDLEQWSGRYEAAAKLPLLVRRLVLAAHGVTKVSFRTDAGVRLPGWDGFCEGTEPHPYVTVGPAGWEFSVQKDGIAAKATDDFNKRAAESDAAQITFVYVTSRGWGGKDAWVKDRVAEAKFHSVRVIDADDLDGWLDYTPAVHLWWTSSKLTAPCAPPCSASTTRNVTSCPSEASISAVFSTSSCGSSARTRSVMSFPIATP